MVLHGVRCNIRRWRVSDIDSLVRHANNPKIAQHLRDRFPHPYTHRDARDFLLYATGSEKEGANFAIEKDGAAGGAIGFSLGSDVERYSAEVGYWLGEAYWGRGVATEALVLLTEHLFAKMNLLRLFALPFADNAASIRVLEKAGYVREGLLKSGAVKYGTPHDQFLYARVNDGWMAP